MVRTCSTEARRVCWEENARYEVAGELEKGRPKRRLMDAIREDMVSVGVTQQDAQNRELWKICCGDPS